MTFDRTLWRRVLSTGRRRFEVVLAVAVMWGPAAAAEPPPADLGPSPTLGSPPPAVDGRTVVLFDGSDWSGWRDREGQPSRWEVQEDGSVLVRGGDAITEQTFGDFQLHLEFRCPLMPDTRGQARGNSGVYLHGRYEIQVLDSFGLDPMIDGCGALYGLAPPLVNASRPPETWQTYDILFQGPRLDERGQVVQPPRVTVLHNGVAVHNHRVVEAATRASLAGDMVRRGPILLQDHGNPVRYRNIWVRPLDEPGSAAAEP